MSLGAARDTSPVRGFRLALTGGIGSGKSTVAGVLQTLGMQCFDADAESRALTAPGGAALPHIARRFGQQALLNDGSLNRSWMRGRVFADPLLRRDLESILHPLIHEAGLRAHQSAGDRPLVFDIPLLHAQSTWRQWSHRVLVVDCPESVQIERVVLRSGLQVEEVQAIVRQQLPRAARRALADAVLFNGHQRLDELQAHVVALVRHWGLARA